MKNSGAKITVVGLGYVGIANSAVLAKKNSVTAIDIDPYRVGLVNQRHSPVIDSEIEDFFLNNTLNLTAVTSKTIAYREADYVVICVPTTYDNLEEQLDTSIVESVITDVVKENPEAVIVIRSTVPIGFTEKLNSTYRNTCILFCPEFLREGQALHDSLYPSRIIVGYPTEKVQFFKKVSNFADIIKNSAETDTSPTLFMSCTEAESVKLFSNTYLAMRVAFFNELDSFMELHGLNSRAVISGMGYDSRIGMYYNNPSFGFGGECLPKDTKQLENELSGAPSELIKAVSISNASRKNFISNKIIQKIKSIKKSGVLCIGIYRLIMKENTDNFRSAAIIDVINKLVNEDIALVIFEPLIAEDNFNGLRVQNDIDKFIEESDLIIANRYESRLDGAKDKVYTRDINAYI